MRTAETVSLQDELILRGTMTLGRADDCTAVLPHASISRHHLRVSKTEASWLAEDLDSRGGSYLNGRLFQRAELLYGDVLRIGSLSFRFDGIRLSRIRGDAGIGIEVCQATRRAGEVTILDEVTLAIAPGEFVGLLGPSGAGKSTLLEAMCGLRGIDDGNILLDGAGLDRRRLPDWMGFVPQEDIVPGVLPAGQALYYSAMLRLPRWVNAPHLSKVVARSLDRLGLAERATVRISNLSGGQRKRVSVAAELLARPRVLFLDEPTSGLDPLAEFQLMELLRGVASTGCTVVCTTHVLENAHLFDRIAVLSRGRLVFFGRPESIYPHFGVRRLSELYALVESAPVSRGLASPSEKCSIGRPPRSQPKRGAFLVLLRRQAAALFASPGRVWLGVGQPVVVALLIAWLADGPSLAMFFAMIAAFWFGCGNAAQEIVSEAAIYRRERVGGLSRGAYLLSKWSFLAVLTLVQAGLLLGLLTAWPGVLSGSLPLQALALACASGMSVSIGLMLSAWASGSAMAAMAVPLVLIPLILFSGFMPAAGDMRASAYFVTRLSPSAGVQAIVDASLLWGEKVTGAMRVDLPSAFANLNRSPGLKSGRVFRDRGTVLYGITVCSFWLVATLAGAAAGLRRQERG